jgi:hypothetical protein
MTCVGVTSTPLAQFVHGNWLIQVYFETGFLALDLTKFSAGYQQRFLHLSPGEKCRLSSSYF